MFVRSRPADSASPADAIESHLKCFGSQENKKMKRSLEEEQRARKDLEKVVRRVLKSINDPTWDETNL